jgi:hypothetical protein
MFELFLVTIYAFIGMIVGLALFKRNGKAWFLETPIPLLGSVFWPVALPVYWMFRLADCLTAFVKPRDESE